MSSAEEQLLDETVAEEKPDATDWWRHFKLGLFLENPLARLMVGLCPALGVSLKAENTIFMGLASTFVLMASTLLISSIRNIIPQQVRIPVFIVIIASFVTIVELTMKAYFVTVYARLGVFVPLIVVNCMMLGRSEAFASRNRPFLVTADSLGMGLGFTWVLLAIGLIRETLGTGKLVVFNATLINISNIIDPPRFFITFPGAFLVFGLIVAVLDLFRKKEA